MTPLIKETAKRWLSSSFVRGKIIHTGGWYPYPGGKNDMAYLIKDDPQPHYLHIRLEGAWDDKLIGETSDRILALCEKHQARKILFDVMGLSGNPSTLSRFSMSTQFAVKFLKARLAHRIPACRFAVIGHHPLVDSNRFEETVAVNNGLPVRTFTDLEKALAWLEVDESEKTG